MIVDIKNKNLISAGGNLELNLEIYRFIPLRHVKSLLKEKTLFAFNTRFITDPRLNEEAQEYIESLFKPYKIPVRQSKLYQ